MTQAGFTAIEYEWWHFNAFSRKTAKQMFKVIP
jgi:D-alanyl-D-alanine dipeptidase